MSYKSLNILELSPSKQHGIFNLCLHCILSLNRFLDQSANSTKLMQNSIFTKFYILLNVVLATNAAAIAYAP